MNLTDRIFNVSSESEFDELALEVFRRQVFLCSPYRDFVSALGVNPESVNKVNDIPFLPIEFFKSREVRCSNKEPEAIFTSSGTTGDLTSRHYVEDITFYEESFVKGFEHFYGSPEDMAILALLPGYLEREGSSLIYMVEKLASMSSDSGFYLYDHQKLADKIIDLRKQNKKIILIGVTFALLDFAEKYNVDLSGNIVMETGGMKGRRREIPREELHKILCDSFNVTEIHSEYGMTELLSQGYSAGNGIFESVSWMKVVTRDVYNPLKINKEGITGGVNIIDLANINSCSFIQTDDLGIAYPENRFKILGRMDHTQLRGCNMLTE